MTFKEWLDQTMLANERGPVIDLMRHAWNAGFFQGKPKLRPIETAPHDDTPVLIWEDGKPLIVQWFKYNGIPAWRDWDMEIHSPNHCMLIPDPSENKG